MIRDINEAKEIIKEYSGNESEIEDLLIEMADSNVDTYNRDLFDWAMNNMDINEMIREIMDAQLEENMEKLMEVLEELKRGDHFEEEEED